MGEHEAVHGVPSAAGENATVPAPVPAIVSERANVFSVNVAVTFRASVIDTTQSPLAATQAPVQPEKLDDADGVAVSVTVVPSTKYADAGPEQLFPQFTPPGLEEMAPVPFPDFVTVSWKVCAKVAVTDVGPVMVMEHVPVAFVQAPDHPVNAEPVGAVAVRTTTVPWVNCADRKSTRLNSSHVSESRMPSSA